MIPFWLHALAIFVLMAGILSALLILIDVIRYPQHMAIMSAVWPIVALFGGPIALWGYFGYGRMKKGKPPFAVMVGTGAAHCGAGCALGDIAAEWLCFSVPAVAVWFGWQSLFQHKIFAVWIVDFFFAFAFGIVFQYFAIAPMRGLSLGPGLVAALKADTLSLTAWQVGMYGLMALAQFGYFHPLLGKVLEVNTPEFWFIMQIAMLVGFVTSYPVNWWLIRVGIKEKM
jgi:hypothetical protein